MAATCRICGKAIEDPGAPDGAPLLDHPGCIEPGYESDLLGLVALSQRRARP